MSIPGFVPWVDDGIPHTDSPINWVIREDAKGVYRNEKLFSEYIHEDIFIPLRDIRDRLNEIHPAFVAKQRSVRDDILIADAMFRETNSDGFGFGDFFEQEHIGFNWARCTCYTIHFTPWVGFNTFELCNIDYVLERQTTPGDPLFISETYRDGEDNIILDRDGNILQRIEYWHDWSIRHTTGVLASFITTDNVGGEGTTIQLDELFVQVNFVIRSVTDRYRMKVEFRDNFLDDANTTPGTWRHTVENLPAVFAVKETDRAHLQSTRLEISSWLETNGRHLNQSEFRMVEASINMLSVRIAVLNNNIVDEYEDDGVDVLVIALIISGILVAGILIWFLVMFLIDRFRITNNPLSVEHSKINEETKVSKPKKLK